MAARVSRNRRAKRNTGEMGLKLYVPGLSEASQEDIHDALLRTLDSGLGERQFAERVEATWVYPILEAPSEACPPAVPAVTHPR